MDMNGNVLRDCGYYVLSFNLVPLSHCHLGRYAARGAWVHHLSSEISSLHPVTPDAAPRGLPRLALEGFPICLRRARKASYFPRLHTAVAVSSHNCDVAHHNICSAVGALLNLTCSGDPDRWRHTTC